MDDKKPSTPDAEQLLRLLDAQMAASRERRLAVDNNHSGNRSTMRIVALVVILVGCAISLWVLLIILEQMKPERPPAEPVPAETR